MPFSILDLAVLGIVLVSALLAAVRGFTREVLAIAAWAVAAAAAWFFYPSALPIAKEHIANPSVALGAAVAAIFVVTLIIVSLITVKISDLILDSRIGAIDRSLGFVFGAVRGGLICVIAWVFLAWLVQGKMPDWAANARTRGVLESTGNSLQALLPDNLDVLLKQLHKPKLDGEPAEPPVEVEPQRIAPTSTPAPSTPAPQQRRTDEAPQLPGQQRGRATQGSGAYGQRP